MKEFSKHIDYYFTYWYQDFSKSILKDKWGDKEAATLFLEKYWLQEQEYQEKWKPIQNAATRINKPINVVGSRATGKAGPHSDWDYVIEGINSRSWDKIKNSLPGSKSIFDNIPRNIDLFRGPLDPTRPYITIYPY